MNNTRIVGRVLPAHSHALDDQPTRRIWRHGRGALGFLTRSLVTFCATATLGILPAGNCGAQLLLSDDFTGAALDPAKWRVDNVPFESGTSDIAPVVGGGALTFSGMNSAGWWGGSAIATVATFNASPETNLVFQVNRVQEGGVGTSSRSAIWITDAARQRFILFADNRGEGHWEYNRKIGATGDNPTGGGTFISVFNQAAYTDGGNHVMKAVANGQTVKLYLDDVFGAEVAFPYSQGIVFEIGSYARAVNDYAYSVFGNATVTAAQTVMFTSPGGIIQNNAQVLLGDTSTNIYVKIPSGQNATQPFTVRVTTSDPTVALPVGAVGDTVTVTFAAGGPAIQAVPIRALKYGGAVLTLQNDASVLAGNQINVLVPYSAAGSLLQDDFAGASYDTTKWQLNTQGFEAGVGNMTVTTSSGQLHINGGLAQQYWGGASLKTVQSYVATKDLSLVFEMDRTSLAYSGTAGRSGVFITTGDRSKYVFFGQNWGESGWEVNVNPGNPTGGGTSIGAFSSSNNGASHRLKLIANGETVRVYLDGTYGGEFAFAANSGIYFEVGAYARAAGDTVQAAFDNVSIRTEYSPVQVSPPTIITAANQFSQQVGVTISRAMIFSAPATVTVTSRNPAVAIPAGAVNGTLTLTFPVGGTNSQTFSVTPVGVGTTTFDVANQQGAEVANGVSVTVTEALYTLMTDDFLGAALDTSKWRVDTNGLEISSSVTNDSYIAVSNGVANVHVVSGGVGEGAGIWWGGLALATKEVFSARPTAPVTFEIDRVAHTGTGAERRSAILIADASRKNWVMFSDDDLNGGWVYDLSSGTLRQNNTGIAAFGTASFRDGGKHRMKMIANGSTVKLYLDNVFGAEVPFVLQDGIVFEFGAYARSYPDSILAAFDNAAITGPIPNITHTPGSVTIAAGQTVNPVVTVTVPAQLHQANTAHIVVSSANPAVAVPVGGTGGSLTLSFAPGASDTQTFEVARAAAAGGITTLTLANDQGMPSTNTVQVIVQTGAPAALFSENFNSGALSSSWLVNTNFHLEPAFQSAADATVNAASGQLELNLTVTTNYWPGVIVTAATNFQASLVDPVIFEVDRVFQIGTGTGTRSGVYIYDATGTNFILFSDQTENNAGWGYNRSIGQAGDNPTNLGTTIAAFSDAVFRDLGLHRITLVANGQTVRFYLDGVFGIELPFPFSRGLKFALMAAGRAQGDTVVADFDNVAVSGSVTPIVPAQLTATTQNGNLVISWTSYGVLQQADSLTGTWTDITTAFSPYTVPGTSLGPRKFYRVRQ